MDISKYILRPPNFDEIRRIMLGPGVCKDQAMLAAAVMHELLEFVVGIARAFLEDSLPCCIEGAIRPVLVNRKDGLGISVVRQARGEVSTKRITAPAGLKRRRKTFNSGQ